MDKTLIYQLIEVLDYLIRQINQLRPRISMSVIAVFLTDNEIVEISISQNHSYNAFQYVLKMRVISHSLSFMS